MINEGERSRCRYRIVRVYLHLLVWQNCTLAVNRWISPTTDGWIILHCTSASGEHSQTLQLISMVLSPSSYCVRWVAAQRERSLHSCHLSADMKQNQTHRSDWTSLWRSDDEFSRRRVRCLQITSIIPSWHTDTGRLSKTDRKSVV